jgi:hypothetical protein
MSTCMQGRGRGSSFTVASPVKQGSGRRGEHEHLHARPIRGHQRPSDALTESEELRGLGEHDRSAQALEEIFHAVIALPPATASAGGSELETAASSSTCSAKCDGVSTSSAARESVAADNAFWFLLSPDGLLVLSWQLAADASLRTAACTTRRMDGTVTFMARATSTRARLRAAHRAQQLSATGAARRTK